MNDSRPQRKRHQKPYEQGSSTTGQSGDDSGDILRRYNKSHHGSQADIRKLIDTITGYPVPPSAYWRVQKGATEVRTTRFIFTFAPIKPTDWVIRIRRNTGK